MLLGFRDSVMECASPLALSKTLPRSAATLGLRGSAQECASSLSLLPGANTLQLPTLWCMGQCR
jgi:hypothetical protein